MATVSKSVYFDALHDMVNKCSNTVHRTINVNQLTLHLIPMLNTKKILMKTGLNLKLVIMSEYEKYKNIFTKRYTENWSEEVFIITKIKETVPWTYEISVLNGEPIAASFYEKELQKTGQEKFRVEKLIKKKVINCMSAGKDMTICLIVGLIKKTLYKNESILS